MNAEASSPPAAKSPLRHAIESALVALLAAGCCFWFLIHQANQADPDAAALTLWGVGLGAAILGHFGFMAVALKRAGDAVVPWLVAVVLLFPLGTLAWFLRRASRGDLLG
ncbi:MAG: hypothetical protein JO224_02535 [Pelomonas sp.]|nr:hypothetical protein [Roseateles sp.]